MSDGSNANILIIKADDILTSECDNLLNSNSALQCCFNSWYMPGTMVNTCVSVCVCKHTHTHLCTHVCSPEVDIRRYSLSLPTLFFEISSATEPGVGKSLWLCWLVSKHRGSRMGCLPHMALELLMYTYIPRIYVGCRIQTQVFLPAH